MSRCFSKLRVLSLSFLLLFAGNLFLSAQEIKGRVYAADENRPLAGATMRVLTEDSVYVTGFTTDEKGRFESEVKLDNFWLEISYVGYEKNVALIQNGERKNLDLGIISLALDTVSLGGVEVVAQGMVHKTGKIMAYPSVKQVEAATSSLSLLKSMMLPRLFVDPVQESISISGVSGVIYRINGVKASLQEVKALKPQQIARVDYSQLPSMRELDSNSGVLDFILKEPRVGTSLSVGGTSAFTTGFVNGNLNFRTNYKKFSVWDNKKFASVLTLVADRSFHPIQQDIFYSPERKRFVFQENNQDYDVNYGAQLIVQMTDVLKLFMFQLFGGWNYYKSKGEAYEHTLNNFYYGAYLAMTYKGFQLNGSWMKPMKSLSGQYVMTSENNSSINASYKWKNLNAGMGILFPFTKGSKYRTEQLNQVIASDRNVLIRNNRNMFYVSLSYNINWGRSIFQSNKRLQNADRMNSILKVNDN